MKSNWIPANQINTPQTNRSELVQKIYELIELYDENSTRKEDEYIKANLKLVIHLSESVANSDDLMFIEKITDTFCDIIKKQRDVIRVLEDMAKFQPCGAPIQNNYASLCVTPAEGFTNDEQIKSAFINFMVNGNEKKRSSFTANDYILRVQNLWRSFYADYEAGKLPVQLAESVIREEIQTDSPLLNACNYIEELNCYVSMKFAGNEKNRNLLNVRAALNIFGKFMRGAEYEKVKVPRDTNQSKDFSKYLFEGNTYGKSRLVLAIVKQYVEDYQPSTFEELEEAFPSSLQGSLGVVKRIEDVSDKYKGEGKGNVKRYFIKEDETIRLSSGEQIIVCTQFGATNTKDFVDHAVNKLGYTIEKV